MSSTASARLTAKFMAQFEQVCRASECGFCCLVGDSKLLAQLIFTTVAAVLTPIIAEVGELKRRLDKLEAEEVQS